MILNRNIFCSKCEAMGEVVAKKVVDNGANPGETSSDPGSAVKSSLSLTLIATLVSENDKAWSFAYLFHPDDKRVRMYAIGRKLFQIEATVVDVLDRRVLIHREGRTEYIDLATGDTMRGSPHASVVAKKPPRSKSAFSKFTQEISQGVKKIGPNKWEIQRSVLNKVLGNTTMLARSARIVPSVRNGKPNGFKLYAIRPGSMYSLIGMQNGDTIRAINGQSITTPDKALAVYTQVRNASHLSIAFSRRGKAITHDYTIR